MTGNDVSNSVTTSPTKRNPSNSTQEAANLCIIKPKSQLAVQLEEHNYLLLKYQTETTIRGYGLEEYINDTIAIPPKICDSSGKLITNQDFINYQRQDNLLASWLMSSISVNFLSQIVGCKTSQEIWSTINQIFNLQTAARILHYKR